MDLVRLNGAGTVDRDIAAVLADRDPVEVVQEKLCEYEICRLLGSAGGAFVNGLHVLQNINRIDLRLPVDNFVMMSAQEEEVAKIVPAFVRL
jgi:hypothetical protein